MSAWITTTLAVAITAAIAITSANAGCALRGSGHCIDTGSAVDLNSVSDIASKIVSEEPGARKPEQPGSVAAAPAPYTGPMVGVAPRSRAPTIGYSWSLH
jgi:hypothetical protein